MRLSTLIVALFCSVLLLLILCVVLGSWLASSSSLRVRKPRPPAMLCVLGATEETITLPRQAKTSTDGLSGLVWQSGEAVIGEIVESSAQSVTRRIVRTTQLPTAGTSVRWNKFVYQGDPQSALGLAYEEIHIPGPLGELPAWFVPGKQDTWVLLVHGFRASRTEALRVLPVISESGFPTLVMTYRNDSGAPPSPDRLYHLGETEWKDIEAGVSYARAHGAQYVILFGWSMGGCLVETFLHRSPCASQVRAVILDSPIFNWQRVLETQIHLLHLPRWFGTIVGWMVARRAGIDFKACNYERPTPDEHVIPTLLFHGTADSLVPVLSSDLFAQARPTSVTYIRREGAEHTQ